MAGRARNLRQEGLARLAGAHPRAARAARPALSVCAAEARAPRLHDAKGRRDGRDAAGAGADPAHASEPREHGTHALKRHRGGGAVRRAVDPRHRRADGVRPHAWRAQSGPPARIL